MLIAKVYSHPRSGTRLLQWVLKANFYRDIDLSGSGGKAGHWASRIKVDDTFLPVAGLWGSHSFLHPSHKNCFYIYRDGRDVALSLWRTKVMQHPDSRRLSLSEYISRRLDWHGTVGKKCSGTIPPQHWRAHLESWRHAPSACLIRYEELLTSPKETISTMGAFLGVEPETFDLPDSLVGISPNEGRIGAWKEHFSTADLDFFHSYVERDFWGLYNE